MHTIHVGMSRARLRGLVTELQTALDTPDSSSCGTLAVEVSATDNETARPVLIKLSNDDMERDEITDEVWVEIE